MLGRAEVITIIQQMFIKSFSSGTFLGIRDITLNKIDDCSNLQGAYILLVRQKLKKMSKIYSMFDCDKSREEKKKAGKKSKKNLWGEVWPGKDSLERKI